MNLAKSGQATHRLRSNIQITFGSEHPLWWSSESLFRRSLFGTPANAATNRLSGYAYDQNGNQISTGYTYDAETRLVQANAGAVQYGYDGRNKRIWQATFSNCGGDSCMSSDSISLFGVGGKLIGTYTGSANWNNTQTQIPLSFYSSTQRVYFGKKLVATLDWQGNQNGVVQDRLESVGKYYPFGEERNSPPLANDQVKFATYTRDSATGLDYADQRYYASTFGRFMSPDPYRASGAPGDPGSWNRYSYTRNNPINRYDPHGLYDCNPNESLDVCTGGRPPDPHEPERPDPQPPPPGGGPPDPDPLNADQRLQYNQAVTVGNDALDSQQCAEALGAVNGEAAKNVLNRVGLALASLGSATATPVPPPPGAPPGTYYQFTYQGAQTNGTTVTLNSDVFFDPTKPIGDTALSVLDVVQREFGLKSLTVDQFQAFVLLHELGHIENSLPTEFRPDGSYDLALGHDNSLKVFKNCFGFLF
jgi:RHS repeat-associated protein